MSAGDGFCCDMRAMTRDERDRYEMLRAKLEGAVVSVQELADGYNLTLRDRAIEACELKEWIGFERKCCPFFALEMPGAPEALSLKITGRDGVKDFIRAEFSAIRFE